LGVLVVASSRSSLVGFTGSRSLSGGWSPVVSAVVSAVVAGGARPAVGCAAGADALVRAAAPGALVLRVRGHRRSSFVARSVRLVRAVVAAPQPAGFPSFYAFVSGPCPAGIAPAPRWSSGASPSGSWSTAALAAGLGLRLSVFWCAPGAPALPSWAPGSWAPGWSPAVPGRVVRSFVWQPAAVQLPLKEV
jgi:hypothetical protein